MTAPMTPVERTKTLIRIPSESSNPLGTNSAEAEKVVAHTLYEWFSAADIDCSFQDVLPGRQNVIAHLPCPGAPRLLITGHMDTVSANMEAHGFAPVENGGKLFGRGACDDKGPLAAAICAILNTGANRKYDLTFLATVGEEVGMHGAKAYAQAHADSACFDLIIGLEPTGLQPVTAHKGVFRFKLTTRGRSCHSSGPENGLNAIDLMGPVIQSLNAFAISLAASHPCPRTGSPTLSITRIFGGKGDNIIPDTCEITVDVRTTPGLTDQEIQTALAALCPTEVEVTPFLTHAAMRSAPSGPIWADFEMALTSSGLDCQQQSAKYGTDCSYLQTLGPCVVWGPGNIAQAHTANEYIDVAQLNLATAVLSAFLG